MENIKILVTGSTGQVGTELTLKLREKYGRDNVVAAYNSKVPTGPLEEGPKEKLDIRNRQQFEDFLQKYNITVVYHLASLLSAASEKDNESAWQSNLEGLRNVLELAKKHKFKLFWASSVAAFGPSSPKIDTPQVTVMDPTSFYGITKLSGELLCNYYHKNYGVDVRSLRYPGIMSTEALPGGGSTGYATAMFYGALQGGKYTNYLTENTALPMMFMEDAVNSAIKLMEAPETNITTRMAYNVQGFSLSPKILYEEISKRVPLEVSFDIDPIRQRIAESWPDSMDCSQAKKDWGFDPKYGLTEMVERMLKRLKEKLNVN